MLPPHETGGFFGNASRWQRNGDFKCQVRTDRSSDALGCTVTLQNPRPPGTSQGDLIWKQCSETEFVKTRSPGGGGPRIQRPMAALRQQRTQSGTRAEHVRTYFGQLLQVQLGHAPLVARGGPGNAVSMPPPGVREWGPSSALREKHTGPGGTRHTSPLDRAPSHQPTSCPRGAGRRRARRPPAAETPHALLRSRRGAGDRGWRNRSPAHVTVTRAPQRPFCARVPPQCPCGTPVGAQTRCKWVNGTGCESHLDAGL